MTTTPEIGVLLPTLAAPGEPLGDVAAAARHADELGFESVWAVDQLVAGTGGALVESSVALAAAAAVTRRVRLGYGVLVVPLRPAAWVAKQVASVQHLSGGRVLLGVGVGGDRHDRSWPAVGVSRRERGARLDAALRVLPGLIAGEATELDDGRGTVVQLAPGVAVPPILVGGMAEAALVRAVEHGAGWFALPLPPPALVEARDHLAELAAARGRPVPPVTTNILVAFDADPAVPDHDGLIARLSDPDGAYGIPAEVLPSLLTTGGPAEVAAALAALGDAGAVRVVVSLVAGDWSRQAELLAEAQERLG